MQKNMTGSFLIFLLKQCGLWFPVYSFLLIPSIWHGLTGGCLL